METRGRKQKIKDGEQISFRVPALHKAKAEKEAAKLGVSLSDVLRDFIDRFIHLKK